ncbi:hypothetical protein BGX21_003695 [Mortierella sp. AD011]|nr:hypothetical protein BGX20_004038 [Mortierella sp. AD010]KAF9400707.1 hypothetical protein BGX21_003695 [Mortierella sp. AD011]
MDDITAQSSIMKMPPEILVRIASFVERESLPNACLVCKLWLACMRSELWREIFPNGDTNELFFEQFPLYYEHVRSIAVSVPCETESMVELFGVSVDMFEDDDDEDEYPYNCINPGDVFDLSDGKKCSKRDENTKSNDKDSDCNESEDDLPPLISALPEKTLKDCRRLESFEITYRTDLQQSSILGSLVVPSLPETDALIEAVNVILSNNKRTLRALHIAGLIDEIEGPIFNLISEMPRLDSLTFQAWESLTGASLIDILRRCLSNLKHLSLETNDLFNRLWELRRWRIQWDSLRDNGEPCKMTADQIRIMETGLTKIQTLILDRSNVGMQSLLDLAAVMPDLRELSLNETYGIGQDDEDLDSDDSFFGENESDVEDNDNVEEFGHNTPPDLPPLIPAATPIGTSQNIPVIIDTDFNMESQDDDHYTFQDHSGDEWEDIESDTYDELNDHPASIFPFVITGRSVNDIQDSLLFRKMRQLHAYCPLIQSFDFSECRPDRLDGNFLELICELWGSSQPDTNRSYRTSGRPQPAKSPGLKVLAAANLCSVKPRFFDTILRHCGSTLTKLDLSLNPDIRWVDRQKDYEEEIDIKMYYTGILNILNDCPTLEVLHAESYPVNARLIASEAKWTCTRMKSLSICIEFDATEYKPGGEAAAKELDRMIQIETCRKLGQLTRLQSLRLEGGRLLTHKSLSGVPDPIQRLYKSGRSKRKHVHKRSHLTLSLSTGLAELAGLTELRHLDLARLGPHCLRKCAEVEWLGTHWPALKRLDGFYDRDIVRSRVEKIRDQLGPLSRVMPTITKEQQLAKDRCERKQKKGILFTPEMDLGQDPAYKRLRELRNITVDQYLMQTLLDKEGLRITAVFEKNGIHVCGKPGGAEMTEEEEDQRRYNDYINYIDASLRYHSWPAAGGRVNSELMSDVMRPREGRSPSPLETWY